MRRLIIGGAGLAFILFLGITAIIFFTARSSLAEELDHTKEILRAEENIDSVNQLSYYYGEEAVYSAEITNSDGEAEWLFVQDGNIIDRMKAKEGLSRIQAEDIVKERFGLQKIRSVKPGFEQGEAIYEVTFKKENRLHFYYMSLENGEFIKRYSMKQS